MGSPFVGRSGRLLDGMLKHVGLSRAQANVANVCQYRPPDNDISVFFPKGEPNDLVLEGVRELVDLIEATKPKAILALGNTALWALTSHRGISDRRGSVYAHNGIPVLAMMHPAALLRAPTDMNLAMRDMVRFKSLVDGTYPGVRARRLVINPTHNDIAELRHAMEYESKMVAVDIETGGGVLQCVGFAPSPEYAVCIPCDSSYRRGVIQSLLATFTAKVFHNAPYDVPYLQHKEGMTIYGPIHDTLAMQQALHPELPRSLAVLTSLYTTMPYYKDMGVLWQKTDNYDMYWQYNALDVSCTIECAERLLEQLDAKDLRAVYERTREVLPVAIAMSVRGIKYDSDEALHQKGRLQRTARRWQAVLNGRAGYEVNVNSPLQVRKMLYQDLKLPTQTGKEGGATTSQKALLTLYPRIHERKTRKIVRALLYTRQAMKLLGTYLNTDPSPDGRMRSSFNPAGTETGRWSASKYLITEGVNLQTVPPGWKSCFVADEGMVLWNADYSQIEARLVAYLANDERSIRIFEDPKGDIHKENASVIFNKPVDQITDNERQLGKTVHALNYGVTPPVLMETVNKRALETGVWLDLAIAKKVREIYLTRFEQVTEWQADVWAEVQKTRTLTNPFGRRRIFTGPTAGEGSEHTKKEALAFIPQSTVPDLMNQALLKLVASPPVVGFEVLLNVHDALFGQAPISAQEAWIPAVREAMQIPFTINGHLVRIPVDIKIGPRWSQMRKV